MTERIKIFKTARHRKKKRHITFFKGTTTRLTAEFSTEIVEDRRQWNEKLKEISFKNEGELDFFRQEKMRRIYHQQPCTKRNTEHYSLHRKKMILDRSLEM